MLISAFQYLDMNTLFLFGESIGMLSGTPPSHAEGFLDAFQAGFNGCGMRIALGPLAFLMPKGAWLKACDTVHKFANVYVDRTIEYREKSTSVEDGQDKIKQRTLLSNMAQAAAVDRTVLRNQVVQAMMAATETTASLVSHVIRNLASHPAVFAQVRAEVLALGEEPLDFDQLPRIKSLQNVITESKHTTVPPVPFSKAVANFLISSTSIPRLSTEQSRGSERYHPTRWRRPRRHCSRVRARRHSVRHLLRHAPP